jgi:anti-sigma B factor antagonist
MFNLELRVSDFDGHAVVALDGDLDLADVPGVASHLTAAAAACGPSVIVDMTGLEFIDCCGLGMLVGVLKRTRASGGDLPLVAPRQRVRWILSLTGLLGVFSVYPSVEQAVCGAKLVQPTPSRPPVLADTDGWRSHRTRAGTGRCRNHAAHPPASPDPRRLAMARRDRRAWPPPLWCWRLGGFSGAGGCAAGPAASGAVLGRLAR